MSFQVSPGVDVNEVDQTNVIPALSTSIGAYAGKFGWGPVDEVVNISDEKELARNYSAPTKALAGSYFTASTFLKYGNALLVSRAVSSDALNASSSEQDGYSENFLIKNLDDYESAAATTYSANFYARYPGDIGNSLKVMVQPAGIQTRFNITDFDVTAGVVTLTITDADTILEDGLEIAIKDVRSNGDLIATLETTRLWIGSVTPDTGDDVTAVLFTNAGVTAQFDASSYNDTTITASGFIYAPVETQDFNDAFINEPSTSAYAETYGVVNDELNVMIIDEDGKFSGTPGTILETFGNVSAGIDAKKENGETNYYKSVINRGSKYIYADNLSGIITGADASIKDGGATFAPAYNEGGSIHQVSLGGGADGDLTATGGIYDALDLLKDTETYDLSFLFAQSDADGEVTIANRIMSIAFTRKDCIAFVSPDIEVKDQATEDEKLDKVLSKFNKLPSNSYAVFDSTPIYVYDKYNDEYVWVPASGSMAGLCAKTDDLRDPWWSPAGYNRGQFMDVAKVAFNAKENARDELYKNRVNPIVSEKGQGIILKGDKTASSKPSAFDRINVRRLFITIEKAIATAAKYQLFEFNDEFTRAQFRGMVVPYLRDVQGRRGISNFRVVCDESNNTGEVIDTNRFVGDIYVKPAKSINYITLNFVATRSGVAFEEIVGQF